jgi:hypothetical protein
VLTSIGEEEVAVSSFLAPAKTDSFSMPEFTLWGDRMSAKSKARSAVKKTEADLSKAGKAVENDIKKAGSALKKDAKKLKKK